MFKYILAIGLLAANLNANAVGISGLFSQLATQSGTQGPGGSVDDVLLQLSTQINNRMPISVDNNTRLDRVSAEPGRRFNYHYTVIADSSISPATVDFSKTLKPQLKSKVCSSTDAQKFLKNGVTVSYLYKDKSGRQIGGAEFQPSDCGY